MAKGQYGSVLVYEDKLKHLKKLLGDRNNIILVGDIDSFVNEEDAVIHEIIHALTKESLDTIITSKQSPKELLAKGTITQKDLDLYEELKEILKIVDKTQLQKTPSVIDERELIANLGNKKFFTYASKVKVGPKTILQRIWDAIAKWLAIGEDTDMYTYMYASLEKYFNSKAETIAPEQRAPIKRDYTRRKKELEIVLVSMEETSKEFEQVLKDLRYTERTGKESVAEKARKRIKEIEEEIEETKENIISAKKELLEISLKEAPVENFESLLKRFSSEEQESLRELATISSEEEVVTTMKTMLNKDNLGKTVNSGAITIDELEEQEILKKECN